MSITVQSRTHQEHKVTYENEMTSLAHGIIGDLLDIIDSVQSYMRDKPKKIDMPALVHKVRSESEEQMMTVAEQAEDEIIAWLKSVINRSQTEFPDGEVKFFLQCDLDNMDKQLGGRLSKMGMMNTAIEECKEAAAQK